MRSNVKNKDSTTNVKSGNVYQITKGMAVSSSNLPISQSLEKEAENFGFNWNEINHPSNKTLLKNNRMRPLGRTQSKSRHRRETIRSDYFINGN